MGKMEGEKVAPYFKDAHIELILDQVNDALVPLESKLIAKFKQPKYPIILITGPPRSGTTLVMQLLIACFDVGYISNLMARFWKAPYIGALLFQELRRRQPPQAMDFASELGATYGYEGPHEFGFFWQRWFPYNQTRQRSLENLKNTDFELLRRELAAVESVFDAPLAFKNPIVFSLHMDILAQVLPTTVFVVCRRDPVYTAQSLLLSRLKAHGRKEAWFSIKPKEYAQLQKRPYAEQIAGQIYYTEKRIQESLSKIPSWRYVTIAYEKLCSAPMDELKRIQKLVEQNGGKLRPTGYVPTPFESRNVQRVNDTEFKQLNEAIKRLYSSDG
jgi:hypothetical protein